MATETAIDSTARNSVLDILSKSGNLITGEGDESTNDVDENLDTTEVEGEETEVVEEEVETESVGDGSIEIDSSTLANLLGIDESDIIVGEDGSARFRAKVDGKEQEISFDNLIRNYQLQQHVDNKAKAVKAQKDAIEAEHAKYREKLSDVVNQAMLVIKSQEDELITEYQAVDWAKLESTNPTQYVISQQKFRDRLSNIHAKRQELGTKYQAEVETAKKESEQKLASYYKEQSELMVAALPEWKDPAIAKTQAAELKEYILSQGFEPQELEGLADHRAWLLIRKARLYDLANKETKTVTKKITTVPKVIKGKSPQGTEKKAVQQKAVLKDRAKTGDSKAQVAFVNSLLNK